jgi:hypothetical protein
MNPVFLVKTATALLGITAVAGMVMAGLRFAGADRPPSWMAMLHGLLAGSGLTLVLYAGFAAHISSYVWIGTALLLLTASIGIVVNLRYHDKRLPLPKWLVVLHTFLAVLGYGTILMSF